MSRLANSLLELNQTYPMTALMRNVPVTMERLQVGDVALSCSVHAPSENAAWTVSIKGMLVGAARDELVKLPRWQARLAIPFLWGLGRICDWTVLDRIVGIDNACLSTNLVSQPLATLDKEALTSRAVEAYPGSALMVRSLNASHHPTILKEFEQAGWWLLVNRQVYLIEDVAAALEKRSNRNDIRLQRDGKYRFRQLTADSASEDFEVVQACYDQLYLDKYTFSNVQFTALLFQEWVKSGLLDLFVLENAAGTVCGCVGMVMEEGMLTTPVLGYDLSLPQSDGLYRRLCLFITQYCFEKGYRQHLSAGASDFKKTRGAYPTLEYTAVYAQHLPFLQRCIWKILYRLTNTVYGPLLVKKGL